MITGETWMGSKDSMVVMTLSQFPGFNGCLWGGRKTTGKHWKMIGHQQNLFSESSRNKERFFVHPCEFPVTL